LDLDPAGKVKVKMQFRERSSGEREICYLSDHDMHMCGSGFHLNYAKGGG